jgi:hypothetical protein
MNDIKSVVSVIKILERTVGILENCNDVGEIPDVTRKRIIEMLNKATLEIYFLNSPKESDVSSEKISENEKVIETSEISNVVETAPEETYELQPASETVAEENVVEEKYVPEEDMIPEEEIIEIEEDVPEENVVETVFEEDTILEDSIFQQRNQFDKPLFEWKLPEPEPVREPNKDDEINILKLQLEEERKRLEQELQNWQEEKRKRDDEMLATQKLLEALQQQAAISRAQQNQATQPVSRPAQSAPQQSNQSNQPNQRVQQSQPVQPAQPITQPPRIKIEVALEPAKKEESTTLLDSFGTKKILYENFESDSVINQISTPVSSLPKAIGINDKFRFIKELFGGDSDLYNETIKKLDTMGSLVSAISYIESNFSWDKNSDSVKQLISLIRRKYI